MILAAAVVVGLAVSLAQHRGRAFGRIAAIPLHSAWLVLLAVALQLPLLRAPAGPADDFRLQQVLFLASFALLLAFVWRNRRLSAALIVGAGVICNLLPIVANGGLMPITPETLVRINPGSNVEQWQEGSHFVTSKDVILAGEHTRLRLLSDALVVPPPFPWPTAFSLGDLVIAAGIVAWLQASPSRKPSHKESQL